MLILASVHWRKINGINFSQYKTYTNILNIWLWTISNKLLSMVNTIVELHGLSLMQLLIISSLTSVSRYVSYCEASIAISIVSWGECIVAALFAWHASGPEFDPHIRHILSWRLDHENISTAILPLPLIQEEQLSVTGERMCTKYW